VDDLTIPSTRGNGVLRRITEVFDCWFESGSVPYAQSHYPFENKKAFESTFPADFIAEGIDQTRGWFYTLLVLSTALFGRPPYKNLIVNGLVLASDGQKMSKRLRNYPDPMEIVNKYGADALRLYLVNSPVVRAETLRFKEAGVKDVVKDVFLPWFNAYRFLMQNVERLREVRKKGVVRGGELREVCMCGVEGFGRYVKVVWYGAWSLERCICVEWEALGGRFVGVVKGEGYRAKYL